MEPVQVERFYLGCLAHASCMVGSDGFAAVIDPRRDVDIYIDAASKKGWKIAYIIETHVHADFVSGHLELAKRTGAQIYIGAGSGAQFPHVAIGDADELRFGNCSLRFLQTPGHTLESICILMNDRGAPELPAVVFTGDTLFAGDVGRPDLSLCGRQMSSESSSTIGKQRQSNDALLARHNLPARPEYFAQDVDMNRRGAAPLSELPHSRH